MFLLPVGSIESLGAAISCKADGVYFGVENFNARKGAGNFSLLELRSITDLLHSKNVKVFITVNILFEENELEKLYELLFYINGVDVDGIIIQDMAVYRLWRDYIKSNIPLISSTQMNTNNIFAVRYIEELGFDKCILARELSKEEIEYICANTKIKIEIFVHGALCYAYSGLCYMSQFIGGRSGNRGECAQPCRLEYDYNGKKGFFLSTKDLNLNGIIPKNIHTCKIEGRLKDKDYVGTCSKVYKDSREDYLLDLIYHREYTKGNFLQKGSADVIDSIKSEKFGYYLGKLERKGRFFTIIPDIDVKIGDKLYFPSINKGIILKGLWDGKNNFLEKSEKGKRVYLKADINQNYIDAYINSSHITHIAVDNINLKKESAVRINGNIRFYDNLIVFEYESKLLPQNTENKYRKTISLSCEIEFEQAKTAGLNHDYIKKIFEKSGNSLISLNIENSDIQKDIFIKVKDLNAARNYFIEHIIENISFNINSSHDLIKKTPQLSIKLDSTDQFEILKKSRNIRRFARIYIPAEELNLFIENVIPYIPPVLDSFFYDYDKIIKNIKDLGYMEILAADHGGIFLCKKYGLSYSTDYTLNVRNSLSLEHYKKQGADNICISTEPDSSKQQELSGIKNIKTEVMVYGRRLSMISVNCLDYNAGICKKKNNCRKTANITNSRGDSFIIKCRDCHIYYYEDRIFGNLMNIKNINADILRIDAICLNSTELNKVLEELNNID